MKKHIATLALATTIGLGSLGIQNRAEAMVIFNTTPLFLITTLSFTAAYLNHADNMYTVWDDYVPTLYGISFVGFILDKKSNSISFKKIEQAEGQKLKLSAVELEAFNGELDRINGALQEVAVLANEGAQREEILEAMSREVSPEAFSALRKVSEAALVSARK